MPSCARQEIVSSEMVSTYHVIARCVRRAYLCGFDAFSGKDYNHRKQYVLGRLRLLSEVFLIEIGHYAIMSNHLHLQLRIRPDHAMSLSKDEVLKRWWKLFPQKIKNANGGILPEEIKEKWLADEEFILKIRKRICSLSWFMRCLCEPIAKKANKEDEVTGRFWEGRFKSQRVLDDESILKVGAYIDLNPIRAKSAHSLETSYFTSAHERLKCLDNSSNPTFLAKFSEFKHAMDIEAPFLQISDREYIDILNWYIKEDLERKIDLDPRPNLVSKYGIAIGNKKSLQNHARTLNKKWLKGVRSST